MLIIECHGRHKAAKTCRWIANGSWVKRSDYDGGMWFSVHQFEPTSLSDLTDVVLGLQRWPKLYVVRGELNNVSKALVSADRCIRRCYLRIPIPDPCYSCTPWRQWGMAEIGNYEIPTGLALGSERCDLSWDP